MKKSELQPLIDVLIPKLFSFAYALVPDELQAQQIVIDAYSVFVIREKEYLETVNINMKSKKERAQFLHKISASILCEIYKLGQKRASQLSTIVDGKEGLPVFYNTELSQRALIFLKYKMNFSTENLQKVLRIQRHQVLEKLYNARNSLQIDSTTQKEVQF